MSYPTPQPPDKTHLSHVVTPRLDPGTGPDRGPESAKAWNVSPQKVGSGCLAEVKVSFQHFIMFVLIIGTTQYLSLLSHIFLFS